MEKGKDNSTEDGANDVRSATDGANKGTAVPKEENSALDDGTKGTLVPKQEENHQSTEHSHKHRSTNKIMSFIEPPVFISDTKSYAEYKADLNLWSRITSLDKKLQADVVVYRLEGHPTRIKEKITTQLGDTLQNNEDGIKELLIFMDSIFLEDDMADAWDKFSEFTAFQRKPDQPMAIFIAEWENSYYKAKKVGCDYSDMILAFKVAERYKIG